VSSRERGRVPREPGIGEGDGEARGEDVVAWEDWERLVRRCPAGRDVVDVEVPREEGRLSD
jgi:hypothetical protein